MGVEVVDGASGEIYRLMGKAKAHKAVESRKCGLLPESVRGAPAKLDMRISHVMSTETKYAVMPLCG